MVYLGYEVTGTPVSFGHASSRCLLVRNSQEQGREDRCGWFAEWMMQLVGLFASDVTAYAVMSGKRARRRDQMAGWG